MGRKPSKLGYKENSLEYGDGVCFVAHISRWLISISRLNPSIFRTPKNLPIETNQLEPHHEIPNFEVYTSTDPLYFVNLPYSMKPEREKRK